MGLNTIGTLTWPAANTAFFVPMWIPFAYPVRRVFWANQTVTTQNMDFGIYTADGSRIYSTGSTAASGANAPQYVTPSTDFILAPGRYYFALSDSSTTANEGGQGSSAPALARLRLAGVLEETSALPLPATMTPVAATNSRFPLCGVTLTTTGF